MQGSEETLGIAECCGGNTQGSDTSGSDTEPLNIFIDRFCSLQDTLHQDTSHCSNHGRPPANDKIFIFTDNVSGYFVIMSQHYMSLAKSQHLI